MIFVSSPGAKVTVPLASVKSPRWYAVLPTFVTRYSAVLVPCVGPLRLSTTSACTQPSPTDCAFEVNSTTVGGVGVGSANCLSMAPMSLWSVPGWSAHGALAKSTGRGSPRRSVKTGTSSTSSASAVSSDQQHRGMLFGSSPTVDWSALDPK